MKKSISVKIFMYMFIFSAMIVVLIGAATRFILPTYYLNQQLDYLNAAEIVIREDYLAEDKTDVMLKMESMQNDLGGELYYYDETTGQQGYAIGKGKNQAIITNSEKFIPSGNISVYTYTNKIGIDVYVMGIRINESYLVYEVSIQTLNRATDTMMSFIGILLIFVFGLATAISYLLSGNISKPIKQLNKLAESMKTKNVDPYMVTQDTDEISQLNQTLNELYEELRGNIYKLNSELNKERNAEQLKKRFLAQATHELKTPIAVIRGYAEILYDGMYKNEDERDRYLKNIYDESESVSHLILDVLDYTKMETGNYKLKLSTVKLKIYLMNLFDRYYEFIKSHDLEYILKVDVKENFVKVMDQDRFEQIYKNLISNAVEHGKSKIKITVESFGESLRLSVYNDGDNISEEDLPNVFESFYKKEGKKTGSGLGLAIVKEIVLLHNGEYRVENRSDGVEFIIIL